MPEKTNSEKPTPAENPKPIPEKPNTSAVAVFITEGEKTVREIFRLMQHYRKNLSKKWSNSGFIFASHIGSKIDERFTKNVNTILKESACAIPKHTKAKELELKEMNEALSMFSAVKMPKNYIET